jgi:hypothetical protein
MREKEIIIRLRFPPAPRKRWLVGGVAALICVSASVYAALSTFTAGQPLKAADLNANFNQLSAHMHPIAIGVTSQQFVGLASGGAVTTSCAPCPNGSIAIGGSCRVTPFPQCDSANVTLVGQGVDIQYPNGVAQNNGQYCCRAIMNSQPQICNLGAWAICVSPSSVAGFDSHSTLQTAPAF